MAQQNVKLLHSKIESFLNLENLLFSLHEKELKCIALKKEIDSKVLKLEKYNENMIVKRILNNDKNTNFKVKSSRLLLHNYLGKSKSMSKTIWFLQRRQEEIEKNQEKICKQINIIFSSFNIQNTEEYAQMVADEINKIYGNNLKVYTVQTKNMLSLDCSQEKHLYKVLVTILAKEEMIKRIKKFDNKISLKQVEKIEQEINNSTKKSYPKFEGEFIILEKQANKNISNLKSLLKSENINVFENSKNLEIFEKILENSEKMQKNSKNNDNFEINYTIS